MNEEIRMNEINEEALENVSGGTESATSITCPECKGKMLGTSPTSSGFTGTNIPKYICLTCRHAEW